MNMQSEQINELAEALSKAQAMIEGAAKDSKNPFFKSSYADLHSVIACAKEPLASNGLSVVQPTQVIEGQLCLVTMLMHKSGQWLKSIVPLILAKQDPQSVGSALSYYRRYSYCSLLCISQVDDDAEGAMKREAKPVVKNAPEPLTIETLESKLSTQGVICDRASLAFYVKEKAVERGESEDDLLKAVITNPDNLGKFSKAYQKRFPIPDYPIE